MSYRLKLTVTIVLLIAVSLSIGGTLMISTSFHASIRQETDTALNSFENIQNTLYILNALGDHTDFESLTDALSQMETQHHSAWQALSLESPEKRLFLSGNQAMLQYTLPAPADNQCSHLSVSDEYGHGLLVMSIIRAGSINLQLLARFDLSDVYALRQTQQNQFLVIYICVVLMGTVLSVVLSFALTRHLHRLTVTVRKISGGNLSVRSHITADDEFGQLSRDFDAMADKLQENISRLESDMQRQESFMGAFAHELKTPMTSIIGYSDLLRQGNLDESTRIMAANYIHSEGHRLERLSFKLLELLLLKKDSVEMRPVWLHTYLHEIEQTLAPSLKEKGIRLVCKAEQRRTVLEPDLVKSLLYNLVDNSAKAIGSEGVIAIKATAIPGGCQFQIADNGQGMEQENLTRITEAFYRVDKARSRSQGGAGLGLALCKQIAQIHNGSLSFASEPGKGTRVTVTLYGKAGEEDA